MSSRANSTTPPASAADGQIELGIGGMTCASCATRIEKRLNRLDGVTATVNYATEKAKVTYAGGVAHDDLVAEAEKAGYTARLPEPSRPAAATAAGTAGKSEGGLHDTVGPLRQRLLVSAVLTAPVIAMAMIPALQFTYWQWLSLTLAAPVVIWGAYPFHRAAWTNPRHGTSTMDTLISMGKTLGTIKRNLFWAFSYNVAAHALTPPTYPPGCGRPAGTFSSPLTPKPHHNFPPPARPG